VSQTSSSAGWSLLNWRRQSGTTVFPPIADLQRGYQALHSALAAPPDADRAPRPRRVGYGGGKRSKRLINHPWHTEAMRLDLTDEEAAVLLSLLNRVIADDRYPLSPRIRLLRAVRAKLPVLHRNRQRRDRRRPKNVRQGECHASAGRGAKRHASGGLLTLPSSFSWSARLKGRVTGDCPARQPSSFPNRTGGEWPRPA